MSAAVDANVLLYASDSDSPHHAAAQAWLSRAASGPDLVHLLWPVVAAYLRISTHPRIFARPLAPADARANVAALLARPHVRTAGEGRGFWDHLERAIDEVSARGNLVPDAHLVALMRQHGITTIWTADRDLRRFDGITARNPFV